MRAYEHSQHRFMPVTLVVTFIIGVVCGIGGTLLMQTFGITGLTLAPVSLPYQAITLPAIDLSFLNYLTGATVALCAGLLTHRLLTPSAKKMTDCGT